MHRSVEQHHPEWSDRIEIAYPSKEALMTLKQARSSITPSISARLGGRVGEADHAETVRFVNALVDRINPPAASAC